MDLTQARAEADHMVRFGNQSTPSLKKAVWASILSANNSLDRNALQVAKLVPYVKRKQLPSDPETVQAIIARSRWKPTLAQAKAIIAADEFLSVPSTIRTTLETMPTTGREWVAWRKLLVKTFKGISWKTASFVALLMWPFYSPFGIVDRHILAHYNRQSLVGKISKKYPAGYRAYRSVERLEAQERRQAGVSANLGLVHWAIWDRQRGQTSWQHDLLSAYVA